MTNPARYLINRVAAIPGNLRSIPARIRSTRAFLGDVWQLSSPYFKSEEKWSAWGYLSAVIALNLFLVYLTVLLNYWNNEFYDVLQAIGQAQSGSDPAKLAASAKAFWDLIWWYKPVDAHGVFGIMPGFTEIAFVYIAVAVYAVYLNQILQIRWRRWATEKIIDEWLSHLAYYHIGLTHREGSVGTENPDQRIQEDWRDFVANVLALGIDFISNIVTLFSFLFILWSVSGPLPVNTAAIAAVFHLSLPAWAAVSFVVPGYLVFAGLVYAIFGTWLIHKVGRPLVPLNFNQQRYESDFRFGLVRVREYAEGIALQGGEEDEKDNLKRRFHNVATNWILLAGRNKFLNTLRNGYNQAAIIFPFLVAGPRYIAGSIKLGGLMQVSNAFGQVQSALSWFINSYGSLAQWTAVVNRLASFRKAIAIAHAAYGQGILIKDAADNSVRINDLTVSLPTGVQLLSRENVVFTQGTSVVVTGASGSGKSTLFRAMAGIWPFGSGTVTRPVEKCLFLPQKPYIPLGTLRRVICFPQMPDAYAQEDIEQAMTDAGLAHLIAELDNDDGWPQRLSGGEQQRVALARALLFKPDWLFLDEATASLDPKGEAALYEAIKLRLPKTTVISIAHRPAVAQYHDERIELQRTGDGAPGRLVRSTIGPSDGQ